MPRKKTSAQLDREIAESLGGTPTPTSPRVTDLNLFALAELVLRAGGNSTFSNRLERVDYPHIKRTLAGGFVEVSSPTTLVLTAQGRDAVLRRLRRDLTAQSEAFARDPSRFDARSRARIEQLRVAIARLEAGP